MKLCSRCGEEKPATADYFHRNKQQRGGLHIHCKSCVNEYVRKYHQEHKQEAREYREANKEKLKAARRVRDLAKKERKQRTIIGNRDRALERTKERQREYRDTHKQYERERKHRWFLENREKSRAAFQRRRAIKLGAQGNHTVDDVRTQYQAQRGTCYYCKAKVGENYHVDHVIPLSRGGSNGPENIVIACPFCNLSKRDRLPHEWAQGGRLI